MRLSVEAYWVVSQEVFRQVRRACKGSGGVPGEEGVGEKSMAGSDAGGVSELRTRRSCGLPRRRS